MTNTTNYDLILVEGSDKVNPLTQVNPNFESIDEQMKKNADAGVTTATELLTGSIHGLSRVNADASMFRFTATSNYTAGDTFTVDGVQVTALTPTGEALGNGAYIIGSEVLCCLKGTLLTMFLSGGAITTADNALKLGGEEPSYYGKATDVTQAQQTATAAGVLATSVQTQVSELAEHLNENEISPDILPQIATKYISMVRVGNVVFVDYMFHNNGAVIPDQVLFYFPEGYKPKNTGYKYGTGAIASSGNISNADSWVQTLINSSDNSFVLSTGAGGVKGMWGSFHYEVADGQ